MRNLTTILALLAILPILAAGCGTSGGGEGPAAGGDSTAAAVDTLPEPEYVASPGAGGLIPREVLFGNPENILPELSPDGERITCIAPAGGVLNLWIMDRDGSDRRQLTFDEDRGIINYHWAENGRQILYMQDEAGEENTHVYLLDVESGEVQDLTPYEGVKAYASNTDRDHPNRVLIHMNRENPMYFDVYAADLTTGELEMIQDNPGELENGDMVLGYMADSDLVPRLRISISPEDGTLTYWVRDTVEDDWRELLEASPLEEVSPREFSEDGDSLYLTSNTETNTTQLYRMSVEDGGREWIAGRDRTDVAGVSWNSITGRPKVVWYNYFRRSYEILDPAVENDYRRISEFRDSPFSIASADHADSTWIVAYTTIQNPAEYYVYDRTTADLDFLFSAVPELEEYEMAPMDTLHVISRDSLRLPCYLTLPLEGSEPYPMVLLVHGGPWARDWYGYNPFVQLLADRGFAVLQVQFRGSTGFGKEFLNASYKEWGAAMQDDLTDAVHWAIDEGVADPERVVIMGGSYGGYAALAGVAFTPDLYRCGVDFFGPSNLVTFRESVPPYWRPADALMDIRVGNLEEEREMLEDRSPLNHVDSIRVPMLVVQGANDPRVVKEESDQMVRALRESGNPVTYVVYEDEGHGFAREPNRLDFAGRVEQFLYRHVPGVEAQMFEPVEDASSHLE
jgi:dipeptidyl aminopeptidase/acylaminoacyl peptidase